MRDLTELMQANVAAREASIADLTPGADAIALTVRRVRRRRAVRHSYQGIGAGAAVVVLAAATWFGSHGAPQPAPPALTPSPSVTAPTPTPTSTPTTPPVALDEITGLPPTRAMPAGLLEETTPGWVLSVYRSVPADSAEAAANTVVLSSPTGALYRVLDLPPETVLTLRYWDAGSTTAAASVSTAFQESGGVPRAELDLLTGAITERPITPPASGADPALWYYAGRAAGGAELWTEPTSTDAYTSLLYAVAQDGTASAIADIGSSMDLDPTGRRVITPSNTGGGDATSFRVIDLATGAYTDYEVAPEGRFCSVVQWFDVDEVVFFCADAGAWSASGTELVEAGAAYLRFDLATSSSHVVRTLDVSDPRPVGIGVNVGPGAVVFGGLHGDMVEQDFCNDDVYRLTRDGTLSPVSTAPLPAVGPPVRHGDTIVVASSECASDATPQTLLGVNLGTGTTSVLAPPPPVTADVPVWASGVGSWVVGD